MFGSHPILNMIKKAREKIPILQFEDHTFWSVAEVYAILVQEVVRSLYTIEDDD